MKPKERIQELFGEAVVRTLRDFAARDVETPAAYETKLFGHVTDTNLRESLAEVYFGCRWFLKIAIALQTDNEERKAISRWQAIDFASVCESLLLDSCRHGMHKGLFVGQFHKFRDPPTCTKPLKWTNKPIDQIIERRSFAWLIEVAFEEKIIDPLLHQRLGQLRGIRNTVHLAERAKVTNKSKGYQLKVAKLAYWAANTTIESTRNWLASHP